MSRFITIHGHFYQPPRENPWLEAVETQDSAHPWHDWNERITVECYDPNATARILDEKDRIRAIVNNYASISFNFGPTLLSWLEEKAPETYRAVLEADREAKGAIAQAYNHMILPLANARDQRTQVRWGVRDFERRFGRTPDGMWLPETAVDVPTLEALAAEGIRYTILEPHQAARWRAIGAVDWFAGHLDPTLPYLCNLPSGRSIVIFFYDGPISRAVAFENLLARGELFGNRLLGAFSDARSNSQLVNIATDGETYGHHHRFGEMALAYALQFIEEHGNATITNYGAYLADHPPLHEVDIVERTAWSCSHGVERWRSDCGCNTGAAPGWNQRWRTPLRAALDWLRDEVTPIFEQSGALLDPWAARDAYIDVILDRSPESVQRFLDAHARPGASPTTVLELMEMQRNAMLMYTSCGWFFSDVSGIETVQVLAYAGRVIQLAEKIADRQLEEQFLVRLADARSNLPDRGTARQIYEREIIAARVDLTRVASHYAVASLFDNFDDEAGVYCYEVRRRDFEIHTGGRSRLAVAAIEVRSLITHESQSFELAVLHLGETEITGGVRVMPRISDYEHVKKAVTEALEPGGIPRLIRLLDQHFGETPVSIRSLFRDEQRRILNELCNATLAEAESAFRQLHERYDPLLHFHMSLGIPVPRVLQTAAEFDLNLQIRRLLDAGEPVLPELEARLREARDERVTLDETTALTCKRAIERAAERFGEAPHDLDRLEHFVALTTLIRENGVSVDWRRTQNAYERLLPRLPANATAQWRELFAELGDNLCMALTGSG